MPRVGEVQPGVANPTRDATLTQFWETTDRDTVRLYLGDVTRVLRELPERSVQTVVTSPPYWGLRDYQTGIWEGGDPACDHRIYRGGSVPASGKQVSNGGSQLYQSAGGICPRCGARRVDMQLGSEPCPDCDTKGKAQCGRCFVCAMVAVFGEVRRVLRDDGTLWLNLGDSYAGGGSSSPQHGLSAAADRYAPRKNPRNLNRQEDGRIDAPYRSPTGIPSGNLVGVPWRVALALQANGWVLRQDLIWHKPSPMPESIRNRCTKAHEYLFLLTKRGSGYFYDGEAIKEGSEPGSGGWQSRRSAGVLTRSTESPRPEIRERRDRGELQGNGIGPTRNKRSVWSVDDERALYDYLAENYPDALEAFLKDSTNKGDVWRVTSQPYPGAHFATYPEKLIEPCILSGTSARGACKRCGAPWRRVVEESTVYRERPNAHVKYTASESSGGAGGPNGQPDQRKAGVSSRTVGWEPTCLCFLNARKERRTEEKDGKVRERTVTILTCKTCGADWTAYEDIEPVPEDKFTRTTRPVDGFVSVPHGNKAGMGSTADKWRKERDSRFQEEREDPCTCFVGEVVPCTVLDPFVGSGTTCVVALRHGRRSVGIDLSEAYLRDNAIPRIEGALISGGLRTARLIPRGGGRSVAVTLVDREEVE